MKVFLAGLSPFLDKQLTPDLVKGVYALESFLYANNKTVKYLPLYADFLLDSGAFTFFSQKHNHINWEEYVDRYAEFIKKYDIKKFFELDIDKLIGYDSVKILRKRLENKVGRQCIPVWHKTRGKEDFLNMCDEYSYVAIGGLVGAGGAGASAYSAEVAKYFPWFIDNAHKRKAKIHGLGYTSLSGLVKYHFDSVDSTSWLAGNRFGQIYRFTGNSLEVTNPPAGKKGIDYKITMVSNFKEWKKFQQYADIHL